MEVTSETSQTAQRLSKIFLDINGREFVNHFFKGFQIIVSEMLTNVTIQMLVETNLKLLMERF